MVFVIALLLGLAGGIFVFLPVSTTGHLVIIEQLIGLDGNVRLLFSAFMQLGSALAICRIMRKDVLMLTGETIRMAGDVAGNFGHFLRGGGESGTYYKRAVESNYSKVATLLFTALLPTVLLGILLESVSKSACTSLLQTGIGLLVTGIFLLVTDRIATRNVTPKEFPYWKMLLVGALQGVSVLPGVSRAGITICGEMIGGFSKKTAVRISYLLAVMTSVSAFVWELIRSGGRGYLNGTVVGMGICCAVGSFITASLFGKRLLKFVIRTPLGRFAFYCMAVGVVSLVLHFAL